METIKRIQLLSSTEVEELYARPDFNIYGQHLYFTLMLSEREALAQFSKTKTRIFFILPIIPDRHTTIDKNIPTLLR